MQFAGHQEEDLFLWHERCGKTLCRLFFSDRATVVGVQSYGKGSVQVWQPLSNNQGAARVTIAKWLTPKERAINHVGLTPDVIVEMSAEDFEAERDPHLDAAIETLQSILNNTALPTSMPTSTPAFVVTPDHP